MHLSEYERQKFTKLNVLFFLLTFLYLFFYFQMCYLLGSDGHNCSIKPNSVLSLEFLAGLDGC